MNLLVKCAVCGKRVDKLTVNRDVVNCRTTFVAFCHGHMEKVTLTDRDVASATKIYVGEAFASQA